MAEIKPTRHQTKSGQTFFIRHAMPKDAQQVLSCGREIIGEASFSITTSAEFLISMEEELALLEAFRKDPLKIFLLAELDGRVVGTLDFVAKERVRVRHTGELGMGVLQGFRGQGIGEALLSSLLVWAASTESLEKVSLGVFASNTPAQALYQKLGFEVEGRRKREVRFEDRYEDLILMSKFVGP